jgi:hypothetical protein
MGWWLRISIVSFLALAGSGATARAEVLAWDQAKVTGIAKQLVPATQDLYDTFYKQIPPTAGSGQNKEFYRLKQVTRVMKTEARELAGQLEKGEGHDQTLPSYESLMELVHRARELGARVFATEDLKQKATAVRGVLNQLGPYYDPDFQTLQPVTR